MENPTDTTLTMTAERTLSLHIVDSVSLVDSHRCDRLRCSTPNSPTERARALKHEQTLLDKSIRAAEAKLRRLAACAPDRDAAVTRVCPA